MAIREYKCKNCGLMQEEIMPTSATPPPTIRCPKCEGTADFLAIPTRIGLLTENFSEQKTDITIGKDANRRWQDINDRQARRDKIRSDSGKMGVSLVSGGKFAPINDSEVANRQEVLDTVEKQGFKHSPDTAQDRKILGMD